MGEIVKSLADYLKISGKADPYGLFGINTIVGINIATKSKKKKSKILPRPGLAYDEFRVEEPPIQLENVERQILNDFAGARIHFVGEGQNMPTYYTYTSTSEKSKSDMDEYSLEELDVLLRIKTIELELAEQQDGISGKILVNKLIQEIDNIKAKINNYGTLAVEKEPEVTSKLNLLRDFISKTGHSPAIVKGILLDKKKLITDSNYKLTPTELVHVKQYRVEYVVKVFYIENDKIINKLLTRHVFDINAINSSLIPNILPVFIKAKIITSQKSVNVFGLEEERKKLEGTYADNYVFYNSPSKKLGQSTYTILVPTEKKSLKFILDDIQFINPELKGYKTKQYYEYGLQTSVRIKSSNSIGTITGIKRNESSKRIKQTNLRRLDVVTVRLGSGTTTSTYGKNLKLVKDGGKLPF